MTGQQHNSSCVCVEVYRNSLRRVSQLIVSASLHSACGQHQFQPCLNHITQSHNQYQFAHINIHVFMHPTVSIVKLLRTEAQIFKPPKNYESNSRWEKAIWLWKHYLDSLNDTHSTQLTASISYASKYHHTDV